MRLAGVSYDEDELTEEEIGKDMGNGVHMSEMLTVAEVARLLHVHPNTLRRWTNDGRLKAYRINFRGDRRFKREDVARFLAELSEIRDTVGSVR